MGGCTWQGERAARTRGRRRRESVGGRASARSAPAGDFIAVRCQRQDRALPRSAQEGRQAGGAGEGAWAKKTLENTSDCGAIPSASKKGGSETYVLCGEGVGGRGRVGKRGEGRGPEEQLSASSPQALYSRTLQVPKAMVAAELAFGTLSKLRKP